MSQPTLKDLQEKLNQWGIQYFTAEELCQLDEPHKYHNKDFAVPGWDKLCHIYRTVKMADTIRDIWDDAVLVNSGYRPQEYNAAIGGAKNSRHVDFRALDLAPRRGSTQHFREICESHVRALRDWTDFSIGYGRYDWGVHIDVDPNGNEQRDWEGWDGDEPT